MVKRANGNFSLRICMIPDSGSVTNNLANSVASSVNPLKPSQNKRGQKIVQLHHFLNNFSQLPAVKSIQEIVQLENVLDLLILTWLYLRYIACAASPVSTEVAPKLYWHLTNIQMIL